MEESNAMTGNGKLSVRVTSGNGAYPIEGAYVYIRAFKEGGPLLYSLRTDVNGFSPMVTLPTPPKTDSLSPNGKTPYSEYVITVKKEGYYTNENIGLPMFDGITSIQKVDLLPLTEQDIFSGITPEREYYENDGYASLRGAETQTGTGGDLG